MVKIKVADARAGKEYEFEVRKSGAPIPPELIAFSCKD
jgi:hypothetical protein